MTARPSIRLIATTTAIAMALFAGTVGGMAVALLAGSSQLQHTSFGTLQSRVRPDLKGHVVVYVPLVDWRVRLLDNAAPVSIVLELRGIDRVRAGAGISSAQAANRSLIEVRTDAERVLSTAVRRAVIVAAVGGLGGAVLTGGMLSGVLQRRRWLLVAPLFGLATITAIVVPSVRAVHGLGAQHVEVTAAGGNAQELPAVLRFAEQLLTVGDEYSQHYVTALQSLQNIRVFARSADPAPTSSALAISDLHDNVFVLDALSRYATAETVFASGDFVQVGARLEQDTAPRVAGLGGRLVAVSGNHDTSEYMQALSAAGARVLDARHPTTHANGLLVAGWPDPLEREPNSNGSHRLRVYGPEYEREVAAFLRWWDARKVRPQVVLVHQHGFAHRLVEHLAKTGDRRPLLVLTGHDHEAHVHVTGPYVIVDSGTVGAGGLAAVGEQPATFARLNFLRGAVASVDLVSIEPLTGRASSQRTVVPAAR